MTKIAITGHTSGIGKACADMFSSKDVYGYSQSTGWDIKYPDQIVQDIIKNNCSVFINNAYDEDYQSILLEKLYKHWKNSEKIIINISSYITDYPRLERSKDQEPWEYRNYKQNLVNTFRKIALDNSNCRVHLISPGPVDTPMISHISANKLQAKQVAKAVKYTMKHAWVKEVTVYV
tara:strand:+ start:12 stop:542 length:531 start_codon:yes stop_codon:yes gene_type:complete